MDNLLTVSIAPHIKSRISTKKIMWAVVLALIPSGIAGVIIFGMHSLFVIIASVITAIITEWLFTSIRKKKITVYDGSAFLTGLLLAYNLPPNVPIWLPIVGAFFSIAIGKQVFGGLGHNIFNPALVGRAFLMTSWPLYMTTWQNPRWQIDAVTSATPLAILKNSEHQITGSFSYLEFFLGNRGGCIGEVCILALIAGAAYLFWKGYLTWHIPLSYIATVAALSWIFNGGNGFFTGDALLFVLSGGLVLGAFFMATDYVTSPFGTGGKVIFAIGCGVLTFLIRRFSGYPEGVSYSILIMNACVPIIDKYASPKWFGWRKR